MDRTGNHILNINRYKATNNLTFVNFKENKEFYNVYSSANFCRQSKYGFYNVDDSIAGYDVRHDNCCFGSIRLNSSLHIT